MFRKCSENVRKILSGEKYKYSKRVTQLFITLLERSSGQNFPEYFFRKIWQPLQPEHTGYWSLNSKIGIFSK